MQDIFFDYDAYDIRTDAQATLAKDASYLGSHPDMKVVIGGYCDERGSNEYNLALGQNRANIAKNALVTAGVAAGRIRVVSYGKEKPFCTESNEECWQLNRRAGFYDGPVGSVGLGLALSHAQIETWGTRAETSIPQNARGWQSLRAYLYDEGR